MLNFAYNVIVDQWISKVSLFREMQTDYAVLYTLPYNGVENCKDRVL